MDLIKDEKQLKLYLEKTSNLSNFQIKTLFSKFKRTKEELSIDLKNIKDEDINDKNLKQKLISLEEKINQKLKDKKLELMIIDLEEKLKLINDDNYEENDNSITNENESNKLTTQLKLKIIHNNTEALKLRGEQLNDIQIITAQIKDLANNMKIKVNEQDEAFKNLEEKVIEVDKNIDEGFKDIKEIKKGMKENNKKICCIIFLIIFIVGILCVIIYAIYSDFFSN